MGRKITRALDVPAIVMPASDPARGRELAQLRVIASRRNTERRPGRAGERRAAISASRRGE